MLKAWKKYSAFSNYTDLLVMNMQGRWAVLVVIIMVSTILLSLQQEVNYIAIPVMVAGGLAVASSSTSYSLLNNPRLNLYPITKEKQAIYIFLSHINPLIFLFPFFILISYLTNFFFDPSLFPDLPVNDAKWIYIFNSLILLLNTLSIFVRLLPSLFIEDLKSWYINLLIPLIIHSLLFYFAINVFTNNYAFVLGNFSLEIGSYLTLTLFSAWFIYNIYKSYKNVLAKL